MTSIRLTLKVLVCLLLVGGAANPGVAHAQGTMLLGLVRDQNRILTFNSANPGEVLATTDITGLSPGEVLRAIDIRPANGMLYGLVTPLQGLTTQVRLYVVSLITGVATPVGPAGNVAIAGGLWGMSFNAVVDRVRVVNDFNANARLNPNTGALAGSDTAISGTGGPIVDAIAYDNQFAGATQTTLYAINQGNDTLALVGGAQGVPSPNGGVLTTVGPLGVAPNGATALDFAPDGTLFAALRPGGGQTGLYTIDTSSGAAAPLGAIGSDSTIDSLAVGNASLAITPGTGTYTTQQRFDMVLLLGAPGRTVVSGSALFDGFDVTLPLASCVRIGHTASGLVTIRCPNLGGPVLGSGSHAFVVTLMLDDGAVVSATVNWNVLASTEP